MARSGDGTSDCVMPAILQAECAGSGLNERREDRNGLVLIAAVKTQLLVLGASRSCCDGSSGTGPANGAEAASRRLGTTFACCHGWDRDSFEGWTCAASWASPHPSCHAMACHAATEQEKSARRGQGATHTAVVAGESVAGPIHPRRIGIRGHPVRRLRVCRREPHPPRSRRSRVGQPAFSSSRDSGCSLGQGTNAISASACASASCLWRAIGPACSQPRQGDEQRVAVTRRHLGRSVRSSPAKLMMPCVFNLGDAGVKNPTQKRPANNQSKSVPINRSEGLYRLRVVGELDDGSSR
ncbi:hypothetical protein V8C44DRAFT_232688 [Trichoderma aethiopicum]